MEGPVGNEFRPAHQAADTVFPALKFAQKATAHITACPGYQDESVIRNNGVIHSNFVPMKDVSDNCSAQRNKQMPGIYSRVIFLLSDMFCGIYYLPQYLCSHMFIEHEC